MHPRSALTVVALALLLVPGADATRSYSDPAGDSGAAPDITGVAVVHDAAGVVSIAVTTNQPTLAPGASFWGFLDTDQDATTGFPVHGIGAERFFLADADGGAFFRVNGNLISIEFDSTFTASHADGVFTARLHRDELGTTERFAFLVESEQDDASGYTIGSDFAPDSPPAFEYSFAGLALTLAAPTATPKLPVAGKRFVVSVRVTRNDGQPFAAGSVTCAARAGSTKLRPRPSVTSGSARCAMNVPRGMSGRMLRGGLTVAVADSSSVSRPFVFRIR